MLLAISSGMAAAFEALIGTARVIEIADPQSISVESLLSNHILPGERILFKTLNSSRNWSKQPFFPDFIHISAPAADYMAESGVRTVGVDYLSISGYGKNEAEVHLKLLGSGIWVIEGLYLGEVKPGSYELICLPLNILNGDGAPARAILKLI